MSRSSAMVGMGFCHNRAQRARKGEKRNASFFVVFVSFCGVGGLPDNVAQLSDGWHGFLPQQSTKSTKRGEAKCLFLCGLCVLLWRRRFAGQCRRAHRWLAWVFATTEHKEHE